MIAVYFYDSHTNIFRIVLNYQKSCKKGTINIYKKKNLIQDIRMTNQRDKKHLYQ